MSQPGSNIDRLQDGPGGQPKIKPGMAASNSLRAQSSGDKVTVGCKVPQGFVMQLYEQIAVSTPVLGGGLRDEMVPRALPGETIRLNGCRSPWGEHPNHEIKHAAGLTFGVPKVFWDEWCRQYAESPLLLNGVIFAQPDRKSLVDQAKEEKDRWTGMTPMMPDTDPRIPRGRTGQPLVTSKTDDD
jgi:hypothetical protein